MTAALTEASLSDFLDYEDAVASPLDALSLPWRIDWDDSEGVNRVDLRIRNASLKQQEDAIILIGGKKRLTLSSVLYDLLGALIDSQSLPCEELHAKSGLDEKTFRLALQTLLDEGVLAVS